MNGHSYEIRFCRSPEGKKLKHVTLHFLRDALLYDIRNNAYIEAGVIPEAQGYSPHLVMDVGEDGNVDRVSRLLDLHVSLVKTSLYPYAVEEEVFDEVYNHLSERFCYTVELQFPYHYSDNSIVYLSRLIQEYLVSRVLYDWLGTTFPQAAGKWKERSEESLQEINSVKHLRTGKSFTRNSSVF